MKKELRKTNYVIVANYDNEQFLDECCLLGWNNRHDWFDTDYMGYEILTSTGKVKNNKNGLIKTSSDTSVYVGETFDDCKLYMEMGNREGLNCRVCKLEKDQFGEIKVISI